MKKEMKIYIVTAYNNKIFVIMSPKIYLPPSQDHEDEDPNIVALVSYIHHIFTLLDVPGDGLCAFHCLNLFFVLINQYIPEAVQLRSLYCADAMVNINLLRGEFKGLPDHPSLKAIQNPKTQKDHDRNLIHMLMNSSVYPSTEHFMRWASMSVDKDFLCIIRKYNIVSILYYQKSTDTVYDCKCDLLSFLSYDKSVIVMYQEKAHWNLCIPKKGWDDSYSRTSSKDFDTYRKLQTTTIVCKGLKF